jgi:hypothetical protein
MLIDVTIEGITPLLQHRFNEEAEVKISNGTGSSIPRAKTPRDEAEKVCYRLPDGRLYQPSTHVLQSFRTAGKFHKVGRKQADRLAMAALAILETELVHDTKEFEVDSRPCVIPATRGRVMRHRPRLDKWSLSFTADLDTDIFNEELAYAILADAGRKVGIGDFRPDKGGPFGRFKIVHWQPVKETNARAV